MHKTSNETPIPRDSKIVISTGHTRQGLTIKILLVINQGRTGGIMGVAGGIHVEIDQLLTRVDT